jgi:hypothetical protein
VNRRAALQEAERFSQALRPTVMGPRLAVVTGSSAPCRVLDAKYEPGVRGELLYQQGGHLVRGDLVAADGSRSDWHESGRVVVEPGVVLSPFPHDPDLPGLPAVMDPARLRAALESLDPDPAIATVGHWRPRLLRYRPGKRATVLAGGGSTGACIAKVYHQDRKAAVVAAEGPRLLAAAPQDGPLRIAPVLGLVPDLRLVVQQVVGGVGLDAFLGDRGTAGRGWDFALRRAAHALAQLHAVPAVSGRRRSVDEELARFAQRAEGIAQVSPALGREALDLAERLTRTQALLPPPRLGTVHGDCKPSQFLLDNDDVWLLDLDHCGISDQAVDAGTFLATLRQLEVRHALAGRLGAGTSVYTRSRALFLRDYLGCTGQRDAARIRWQEAVALERKSLRAFARAPRSPLPAALVREAHRTLDSLEEAA